MSNEIVTQTCLVPECNLKDQDVHNFVAEMTEYVEMFKPTYRRPEQFEGSQRYLQGLLGNETRKTIERMALELEENVGSMQHFVGQSPWEVYICDHSGLRVDLDLNAATYLGRLTIRSSPERDVCGNSTKPGYQKVL